MVEPESFRRISMSLRGCESRLPHSDRKPGRRSQGSKPKSHNSRSVPGLETKKSQVFPGPSPSHALIRRDVFPRPKKSQVASVLLDPRPRSRPDPPSPAAFTSHCVIFQEGEKRAGETRNAPSRWYCLLCRDPACLLLEDTEMALMFAS